VTSRTDQPRHHLLVQAPVPPVDGDGLRVVIIGTIAFGLASLVLAMLSGRLTAAGHGSWLGIGISGFLLGLIGIGYCLNRRRRRIRAEAQLGTRRDALPESPNRPDLR
jgi:hypothetical protein